MDSLKPKITFDFDDLEVWGPDLRAHLRGVISADAGAIISAQSPRYLEDARDILMSEVGSDQARLVAAVQKWISSQTVAAYHGSRLREADIEDIRSRGLITLSADDRKRHLEDKLSSHRGWAEASQRLDGVMEDLGRKQKGGKREGQVHATLSRAGLLHGFNHYLTHGSEFDQHAAQYLLGDEGKALLAKAGDPILVRLAIPGAKAFDAANPFLILVRHMPNFVREILTVWAYWLAHPEYSPASERFDCGLIFYHDVPAEWIDSIETVSIPLTDL
jgi:hypothetical protein